MAADPLLVALVEAAERDEPVPRIRVVAGSALVIGVPIAKSEFITATRQALMREWAHWASTQRSRKERRNDPIDPETSADEDLAAWKKPTAASEEVINLGHAEVWSVAGGNGIDIPAIRVPFDAIDAWWVASGEELSGDEGGGFAVGGVLFPLEDV